MLSAAPISNSQEQAERSPGAGSPPAAVAKEQAAQKPKGEKPEKLTSNQMLMRDKLVQMNRVLAGITLNKFDQVEDAAETLRMISRATSWHIDEPTPRYQRLAKSFQEQAVDLKRHAGEDDVDAATLDLVRLNLTCTECHHHMRERDEVARGGK
jgi:hypothetical protein